MAFHSGSVRGPRGTTGGLCFWSDDRGSSHLATRPGQRQCGSRLRTSARCPVSSGPVVSRCCRDCTSTGSLVDGADTAALLRAAGVNLADGGADRPVGARVLHRPGREAAVTASVGVTPVLPEAGVSSRSRARSASTSNPGVLASRAPALLRSSLPRGPSAPTGASPSPCRSKSGRDPLASPSCGRGHGRHVTHGGGRRTDSTGQ